MDLGTMTKKLKSVQYKSKQEFVEDLNLIWANCLKYNANPEHFLRKHALFMRKETEKLVPLIPDIVIRDRADVEREERQAQLAENEAEGAEESDDEPIMSSRGRMAPGKSTKKGTSSRIAPPGEGSEGTPGAEAKPMIGLNGITSRSDPDLAMEGSQNGLSTPPPGTITPLGLNGHLGIGPPGSQGDLTEMDGFINNALAGHANEIEYEDPEYKIWKQVTKKDRALLAAERHRMFKGDKLDPEAPALLRSKAGMRRWLRNQKQATATGVVGSDTPQGTGTKDSGETLAEGMEEGEERMLPDYYDVDSAIPEVTLHQRWIEDETGELVDPSEEGLSVLPPGSFVAPKSKLAQKIEANMRQMQDTRKICAKIAMVKQMQLQSQVSSPIIISHRLFTLTMTRSIKTSFRSTTLNHSSRKTFHLMSCATMVLSQVPGSQKLPCNVLLARSFTMPALKNSNPLLLMLSPILQLSICRS
jgi:transcriptional activator SPT7